MPKNIGEIVTMRKASYPEMPILKSGKYLNSSGVRKITKADGSQIHHNCLFTK
jgi:hypothetical protein